MNNYKKYATSATARVLSVASQFFLLAAIGAVADLSGTGVYGACYSIAATLAIAGSLGQTASAFREIPGLRVRGQHIEVSEVVSKALTIALIGMVVIFLPAILIGRATLGTMPLALFCYLLTVGLGFLNLYSAIARSHGWIFLSEFSKNGLWRLLSAFVLLVFWWFFGFPDFVPGTVVLVVALACSGVMLLCVFHLLYREDIKCRLQTYKQLKSGLTVDLQSWLIQLAQAVLLNMDVVVAGLVLDLSDLGTYFIVTRLASLVALPLSVTNPVIIPVISRIASGETGRNLQGKVVLNSRINAIGALILLTALMFLFTRLYSLLSAGAEGAEFTTVFMLLALSQVSNTVVGPTTMACQLFNVRATALYFILLAVVVQTSLVALLGLQYGLLGVAVAVFFSRVVLNVGIFSLIYRKGRFNLFSGKPAFNG